MGCKEGVINIIVICMISSIDVASKKAISDDCVSWHSDINFIIPSVPLQLYRSR